MICDSPKSLLTFAVMLALSSLVATGIEAAPRESYVALVRSVRGDVRVSVPDSSGAPGTALQARAGDLPDSGATFTTGADGYLTLRFHPDFMTLEAQPRSRFGVGYADTDSGHARRVHVAAGRLVTGVSRQGPPLVLEDAHTLARVGEGRVSFASDAKACVMVVLEGEAEVYNRVTGTRQIVGRGGKAVSDARGTVVTRAGARELAAAGQGQNRLEIDFWNPATEEYRTLEVEYESRP